MAAPTPCLSCGSTYTVHIHQSHDNIGTICWNCHARVYLPQPGTFVEAGEVLGEPVSTEEDGTSDEDVHMQANTEEDDTSDEDVDMAYSEREPMLSSLFPFKGLDADLERYHWHFQNLKNEFREGGALHGKKVYLVLLPESHLVHHNHHNKRIRIPVIVAIVSPFPPCDKIALYNPQTWKEHIVHMHEMNMVWVCQGVTEVYALTCTLPRNQILQMSEENLVLYQSGLPFFFNPSSDAFMKRFEDSKVIDGTYISEGSEPFSFKYYWDLQRPEEYTQALIEEGLLDSDDEVFKDSLEEQIEKAKEANRESYEARQAIIDEANDDDDVHAGYRAMKFYKFYPDPTPHTPKGFRKDCNLGKYFRAVHDRDLF